MTIQQPASLRGAVPMDMLTAAGMLAMHLVLPGVPPLPTER